MLARAAPRRARSDFALIAIGVFKLVKFALLTALGLAAIQWRNQDLGDMADQWLRSLSIDTATPYLDAIIARLSSIDTHALEKLAFGSFVYAFVFLVEGIGLCLGKRWAEFLTIGVSASLLPIELYALCQHVTALRIVVIVVNVAIMWYLIVRVVRERHQWENG